VWQPWPMGSAAWQTRTSWRGNKQDEAAAGQSLAPCTRCGGGGALLGPSPPAPHTCSVGLELGAAPVRLANAGMAIEMSALGQSPGSALGCRTEELTA
jgi:hypothetical protein